MLKKQNNKVIKEYSKDPLVVTYQNVLTSEECEHFINISKDSLKRALVSEDKKGVESKGRTGYNTWIEHDRDEITKRVGERIASIVGLPLENAEKYQIIYYSKTQEYRNHYDSWIHNGSEKTLRCMKYGGARVKTALCYLNDVKKGGGTRMVSLNKTVDAEKGKLLIFQNTLSHTDNTRHPLSEHAGLPVEEGEKFAFNLWFKECNSKMLYKDFNPGYYENNNEKEIVGNVIEFNPEHKPSCQNIFKNQKMFKKDDDKLNSISTNQNSTINNNEFINNFDTIKTIENALSDNDIRNLTNNIKFNDSKRRCAWKQINNQNKIKNVIKEHTGISEDHYENINIIEYKAGDVHGPFLDAYDLNSDKGKKYTEKQGQRLFTITLFLTDGLHLEFNDKNTVKTYNKGDCVIYKNINKNTDKRDEKMRHTIKNLTQTNGLVANIYIRNKNKIGNSLIVSLNNIESRDNKQKKEPLKLKIVELENYTETLNNVLTRFENNEINSSWRGYESFKYNFKGDFELFKKDVLEYKKIKYSTSSKSCLIQENLDKEYSLDPKLPLAIVNNVLEPSVLEVFQNYYKRTIKSGTWILGDRQSNRYKAHNEPMSRFLHYEFLPLIERIVGKSLKPTYTYLSAYVKGADLPQHTDRPDCEYTVSFVVDKPEGSNWNIYVHKPQQPIKHKGRYDEKPSIEECEAVDCDAGGLMIFQGTDHIHFREKLEHDYYNVLLLHYCSV